MASVNSIGELACRRWGHSERKVLCIHGWMMTGAVFDPIVQGLSTLTNLLIPDLRGAGDSPAGASYSLSDYADDIINLLEREGACSLLGHSMGGAVAQLVAIERPDLVEQLILINPVPARGFELPEDVMSLFSLSASDRDKQAAILDLACTQLTATDRQRLADIAATVDEKAIQDSLLSWTAGGFERRLVDITAKTHVIATSDPFLSVSVLQTSVVEQIKDAVLHVLEGPGHYPMWEAPERLVAMLTSILEQER